MSIIFEIKVQFYIKKYNAKGLLLTWRKYLTYKILNETQWLYSTNQLWTGFAFMIMPLSGAAGFFQQGLIHQQEQGLSIHTEKIELSSVINAWCEACQQNCMMVHDPKIKVNIHADGITCPDLLQHILQISDLQVKEANGHTLFMPPLKGCWVAHQFKYRAVAEVKQLLSPLLGQGSKSHLLSDVHTNTIWIPRDFYQQHHVQIHALDQIPQTYQIQLSLVKLHETRHKEPLLQHPNEILKWLLQPNMPIEWIKTTLELQELEQSGLISQSRSHQQQCQINQTSKNIIDETLPVPTYNKRGSKIYQTMHIGLSSEITLASAANQTLTLGIKISDSSTISAEHQTNTQIDTTVRIPLGHSISLGRMQNHQQVSLKYCHPALKSIPVIGRIFCQQQQRFKDEDFYLIISANENNMEYEKEDKLGRLDSNQGS